MAGKISTLVLKVDLDCHRCHRKIRKVICKLQESENIKTIFYDDKNKSVTISGPFDPEKLSEKIKCKASKVIKDIKIKEDKGGNKTKVDKATQAGVHFPEDVLNAEKEKKLKNDTQKVKPVEDRWPPAAPEPAKAEDPVALPPASYFWLPPGPVCGCRTWYGGHGHGGCTCYPCGGACGFDQRVPQLTYGVLPYYFVPHKTLQFFCEED
ncbi:protein PYRICULARIA ORYZAE RESISTANCE 21 [Canna indica]|uniref:Protein PYRICULARIA ORYZAE RESISTANCE 21 n=1 Tax=Canna indica TaxID=4628 RepID=A0AAQ3KZT2_9LILI|nr:protein PYRICULARIA ORYZAE RESISTANCE 21 [Canna indica]